MNCPNAPVKSSGSWQSPPSASHIRWCIFLNPSETEALLAAPDRSTWLGRRDHALMLLALQTGLRLSELTGLRMTDLSVDAGAHVRVIGKGRKERCTPLAKWTLSVMKKWQREHSPCRDDDLVFPSIRGGRLSADAVQYLLRKYVAVASKTCPSLARKHLTPHVWRHTAAMELLQGGVDRTVIALWLGHKRREVGRSACQRARVSQFESLSRVSGGIPLATSVSWWGRLTVEVSRVATAESVVPSALIHPRRSSSTETPLLTEEGTFAHTRGSATTPMSTWWGIRFGCQGG